LPAVEDLDVAERRGGRDLRVERARRALGRALAAELARVEPLGAVAAALAPAHLPDDGAVGLALLGARSRRFPPPPARKLPPGAGQVGGAGIVGAAAAPAAPATSWAARTRALEEALDLASVTRYWPHGFVAASSPSRIFRRTVDGSARSISRPQPAARARHSASDSCSGWTR
jgi:hypothetical protein